MPNAKQLANLRPPIQRGEVRNPDGRNQYSRDRELRQQFRAICRAIDESSEAVSDALCEELARLVAAGALQNWRLLMALVDRLWPLPSYQDYAAARNRSLAREHRWQSR